MSDELTKRNEVSALVPSGFDEMWRFAKMITASGVAGTRKVEEAAFLISYGLELGLPPIKAVQSLHLIKGKVTMSADMMVSLCLRAPQCEYIEVSHISDEACTFVAKRIGRPEQTFTFTMAMAQRAGLDRGDNWRKYPESMLKARAGSHIARQVFPDIVMGIYDPGEILDAGAARVVEAEPVKADVPRQEGKVAVDHEATHAEAKAELAELCGAHWPEFCDALVIAGGKEPTVKTINALIQKLARMSAMERGEWMQAKIDEHLNVEPDEVGEDDQAEEQPADVVDAEFEPAEGVTFDPARSAVVLEAISAYGADEQGRVARLMSKMSDPEKDAFKSACRGKS